MRDREGAINGKFLKTTAKRELHFDRGVVEFLTGLKIAPAFFVTYVICLSLVKYRLSLNINICDNYTGFKILSIRQLLDDASFFNLLINMYDNYGMREYE